jgi:hypothetical protein
LLFLTRNFRLLLLDLEFLLFLIDILLDKLIA